MTGNNKVWRAPLAGLASVAMLATMGVTALTASATTGENVNGSSVNDVKVTGDITATVTYGDSLIDALHGTVPAKSGLFLGYYGEDGKPFDFTAPLTKDVKVTAKYAVKADDVVKVTFNGSYGFYPTGSNTVYLAKGSKLDANLAPTDFGGDGSLTATWKVSGTGAAVSSVSKLSDVAVARPADGSGDVQVTPDTFKDDVTTVRFNGLSAGFAPTSYALNAYADGKDADDLFVDVTSDGTATPQIVTPSAEQVVYTKWKNTPGTNASVEVGKTVKKGTFEIDPASASKYYYVTFDAQGGSDVATQRVAENGYAKQPAQPTRSGFVFKGWKMSGASSFYAFETTKVTSSITLFAVWQSTTSQLTVTFKDQEYDGKHDNVAVKVNGGDFVSEDQAPQWTRKGYVLAGWVKSDGSDFDFDAQVAADVNNGDDFTLTADWVKVTSDVAATALKYVTKNSGRFTDASWAEYETTYTKIEKEYKQAEFNAPASGISDETSAKIVSALKAAWEKLVFAHETGADVEGQTTVHRLSKGGEHFYTANESELNVLTSKLTTRGGWTDEGRLFQQAEPTNVNLTLADFKTAAKNAGLTGVEADKVASQLEDAATPIIKRVYRLYNKSNGDHVWTIDETEYNALAAKAAWNDEGVAFLTPTFTGTTAVTRLYKGSRHLLSTDSNEQKVLSKKYCWKVEGTVFKAY
ncbi:InlB B-repeat-containing protein [Bifidobacterium sp. 82T10]|uniref:InlB B-repeat-containing protein n=1 Tax=Bifidobacterium miconis TaxID=2834435 RepID=A0ABS6WGS4_9BIFI|nr:InlB B-repeat-containing protein [Bifidobacterium miconis]MBW3093263.1 InlB B-repeat-containing protein [Bifidobacterium miconis]